MKKIKLQDEDAAIIFRKENNKLETYLPKLKNDNEPIENNELLASAITHFLHDKKFVQLLIKQYYTYINSKANVIDENDLDKGD